MSDILHRKWIIQRLQADFAGYICLDSGDDLKDFMERFKPLKIITLEEMGTVRRELRKTLIDMTELGFLKTFVIDGGQGVHHTCWNLKEPGKVLSVNKIKPIKGAPASFLMIVATWIQSYKTKAELEWVKKYVDDAVQSEDIKSKLYRAISVKMRALNNPEKPKFIQVDGKWYMMDKDGAPKLFMTRHVANGKVKDLKTQGYNVELASTNSYYYVQRL